MRQAHIGMMEENRKREKHLPVAERFGVSEQQVREIEREGLDGQWPPL